MIRQVVESLKAKWQELPPEKKKKVVFAITIALFVLFVSALMLPKKSQRVHEQKKEANESVSTVKTEEDLLKKAQYYETLKQIEDLQKNLSSLQEELERVKSEKEKEEKANLSQEVSLPPPPPPPSSLPSRSPQGQAGDVGGAIGSPSAPPKPQEERLSGIEIIREPIKAERGETGGGQTTEEKRKKTSFYLPPSFMEATLLSGIDAPAISKGEGHPVPVLLRIKAPAVLPNEVKANLKGCFIIAEGLGNLASERADLRLVSLSCIDKKGRAVIDQKVKGFIVDTDGKIGLRGRVVSKMGSVLARALLAGFVSGVGQALGMTSYDYSVSGEGAVAVPKPGAVFTLGAASGVQMAANELVRFYMELARQTIPVVEVLPTRNVTVVISEGVELTLKETFGKGGS